MKYHTFMILFLQFFQCISEFVKTCNSMQRMIFDKTNCCLKIHNFVCPKSFMGFSSFMGNCFVRRQPVRKAFGIRMINSQALSLPAHFRNTLNKISHSFYSSPYFPQVKQKLEQNQFEQNKQNPYISLFIYIIQAWLCIEEQTYKHLVYTSQIQQEMGSFKQNASIFV